MEEQVKQCRQLTILLSSLVAVAADAELRLAVECAGGKTLRLKSNGFSMGLSLVIPVSKRSCFAGGDRDLCFDISCSVFTAF